MSLCGYDNTTKIAHFYNRDAENAIGFEMRMTLQEYDALSRYIERVVKHTVGRAQQELAEKVRAALPTGDQHG